MAKGNSRNQKAIKSTYSGLSSARINTAAVVAFVPFITSILGIHDFIVKRYKQGIIHIIILLAVMMLLVIDTIVCSYQDSPICSIMSSISNLGYIFCPVGLYIWSIVEGIEILNINNKKTISSSDKNISRTKNTTK